MRTERPLPPPTLAESSYLHERTGWLVRLRWLFIAAMTTVVGVAMALRVLQGPVPLALLAVAFLYNIGFLVLHQRSRATDDPAALRRPIFVQLMLDVVVLSGVLHYSDTVENPFVTFYAFPMVIGAMLLLRRHALVLATAGCVLHAASVIVEFFGWLAHHPLHLEGIGIGVGEARDEILESPWFVATHLLAVTATLFGVVVFVRSVVEQRLRAEALEHEHAAVALSRERLAHVGEISAGVAHAVRNPVHGLMNCVELLDARVGDDPEVADALGMMNEALRRIESVTRRLLVLMRDAPLQPISTDLDALVEDSLKFMSGRAKPKNVRIVKELGAVGCADVDPDRLSEALINVLDNAVDASDDGGTVVVRTSIDLGAALHIEVRDQGVGMTDEQLQKAFHPFFTTKPVGQGTGLGLAISKRILEEHGGGIRLTSEPHRGTSVDFVIPRTFIACEERPS